MRVVLDTNICLLPFTQNVDVRAGIELAVGHFEVLIPNVVKIELTTLSQHNGQTGRAAKGALRMFQEDTVVKANLPGDDGVLEMCEEHEAMLATSDRALLEEAKKRGIPTVRLRGSGFVTTGVADRRP